MSGGGFRLRVCNSMPSGSGKTITIRFTARPGTSQAELDEAYAIIGSMRAEVPGGFRLIFTLATDDWDSG